MERGDAEAAVGGMFPDQDPGLCGCCGVREGRVAEVLKKGLFGLLQES